MSLKQRLSLVTLGPAKTDQCCQASDIKIGQWILCFYHEESFSWLLFSQQLFQCSVLGSATNLTFHKYLDHQYWDQMEQCDLYATELHFEGLRVWPGEKNVSVFPLMGLLRECFRQSVTKWKAYDLFIPHAAESWGD